MERQYTLAQPFREFATSSIGFEPIPALLIQVVGVAIGHELMAENVGTLEVSRNNEFAGQGDVEEFGLEATPRAPYPATDRSE